MVMSLAAWIKSETFHNIRSAKSSSGTVLLFAMFVYPRLLGEALFLHTTYSRLVRRPSRAFLQIVR
jgi:hypothetical protein